MILPLVHQIELYQRKVAGGTKIGGHTEDTQRSGQTEGHTDKRTDRGTHRQVDRQRDTQTSGHTE